MSSMAQRFDADDGSDDATDEAYLGWKRAKIERALEQSRDRAAMIPVEQVWRDLTLER